MRGVTPLGQVAFVFEDLTIPLIALGVVAAFIVLAIISTQMSRGPRRAAVDEAALQAEKDVMRANHAVQIAALERRLAAAQARSIEAGDPTMKMADAEGLNEKLRREIEWQKKHIDEQAERVRGLEGERETLAKRVAELTPVIAERDAVAADRDKIAASRDADVAAAKEVAQERAKTIAELREELATATNRLVRPTDPAQPAGKAPEEIAAIEAAKGVAEREAKALREERDALRARLEEAGGTGLAELRRQLDEARAALAQAAEGPAGEGAADGALQAKLSAAETREATANAELSRLAYELDELRSRAAAHERQERSAKAEVEQRDTLLELRQQKIYTLEERVRELTEELRAAAASPESDSKQLSELEKSLAGVNEEREQLLNELDALRKQMSAAAAVTESDTTAATLRRELEALRAENKTLRSGATRAEALDEGEIEALRRELRALAQRFVTMAGAGADGDEPTEMSLADRIRAFKANRATSGA